MKIFSLANILNKPKQEVDARDEDITIACVDDDESHLSLMEYESKFYNKRFNSNVSLTTFDDPFLFLKQHKYYDLVIVDLVMPKMSGWEFIKKIDPLLPESIIFVASGLSYGITEVTSCFDKDIGFSDIIKRYKSIKDNINLNRTQLHIKASELNRRSCGAYARA